MKIEWHPEDIVPGRIVGKPDRGERWMIGYVNGSEGQQYALVSLADGCIQPGMDAAALARQLNEAGEIPAEFFSDPTHSKRGQLGGIARAAALSPEQRSKLASAAAKARWRDNQ